MARSKSLTGAHVKVYANGEYVGIVTGGTYILGTPVRPVHCVDQGPAAELVPTIVQVQAQLNVVAIHGGGGVEGAGLAAFPEELLRQKYITLTFVNRRNGSVVLEIESALVSNQQWNLGKLVVGSFAVQGITYSNEAAT